MSFEATRRVWEHSQQKKMHLLLLAALAEMTNQRSEVCNPSVEYLADKIGVGERQAQRLLRELEESGELYAPPAVGRTRKTLYFVVVGLDAEEIAAVLVRQFEMTASDAASLARELIELQGGEKVTSTTEKVTFEVEKVTFPAEKVSPMSPEPSINQKEPIRTSSSSPPPRSHPTAVQTQRQEEEAQTLPAEWVAVHDRLEELGIYNGKRQQITLRSRDALGLTPAATIAWAEREHENCEGNGALLCYRLLNERPAARARASPARHTRTNPDTGEVEEWNTQGYWVGTGVYQHERASRR